jgi:hypothetical protein
MKENSSNWTDRFRDRIENHQVPINTDASWGEMQARLKRASSFRIIRRALSVAVCVILLLGLGLFLFRQKTADVYNPVPVVAIQGPQSELELRVEKAKRLISMRAVPQASLKEPDQIREPEPEIQEKPTVQPSVAGTPREPHAITENETYYEEPSRHRSRGKVSVSFGGLLAQNRDNGSIDNSRNLMMADIAMYNAKLFNSSVITGHVLQGTSTVLEMDYFNYEYQYKMPVSFGVYVNKEITRRISIESGLFATRLAASVYYSSFSAENSYLTDHVLWYLGVPLKAKWSYVSGRFFTAYVSAGGAVEKCIHSGYTGGFKDENDNLKLSDVPLQWSLNGTLGAQYNIIPQIGIYIEPGVSYYFNDGSDIPTIRKEYQLIFNLNAGLRFTF